ncbi:MAG TPA: hypothetical protein DCW47_02590 [Lachnospiraceae bacterium]|nr:hypothetical protein [Lachnospiraceae bacterium]
MENDVISSVWPEWSVVKQLGKGAYGVVYEAVRTDYTVESKAAIKVIKIPANDSEIESLRADGLSEDDTRSYLTGIVNDFVGEIQLMESLKGIQNIVSVEDYKVVEHKDRVGWTILIRMELLTPLNAFIGDDMLPEKAVLKLGVDICSALEICAMKKVIHRDIKPENIFINEFGDYKLGDFGVARKLENVAGALSQKGTYNYMAPEVEKGTSYNETVDLYSLGLVLYRFLNRKMLPFLTPQTNMSPNERMAAVRRRLDGEPLPAPADASPEAAGVILKACAFDPGQRYRTASEMKRAINAVLYGRPAPANNAGSVPGDAGQQQAAVTENQAPGMDAGSLDRTMSVRRAPGQEAFGMGAEGLDRTMSVRRAPGQEASAEQAPDLNFTMSVRRAPAAADPYGGNPAKQCMNQQAGYRQNNAGMQAKPDPYKGESTVYKGPVGEFGGPKKKKKSKVWLIILIVIVALIIKWILGLSIGAVLDNVISGAESRTEAKKTTDSDGEEGKGEEKTASKLNETAKQTESLSETASNKKPSGKLKEGETATPAIGDFEWVIGFLNEQADEDYYSVDYITDADEINGNWKCLISDGTDDMSDIESFFDCPGILCTMKFDLSNGTGSATGYPGKVFQDLSSMEDDTRATFSYDCILEDEMLSAKGDGDESFYCMFYRDGNNERGIGTYVLPDGTEWGIMFTK